MRRRLAFAGFAALVACSSRGDSPANPQDAGDDGFDAADATTDPFGPGPEAVTVSLPPACKGSLAADGSALKFEDRTVAWEMDKDHLDLVGNHIEAADLDGDGYPDLLVHMGGSDRSDPAKPGNQQLVRVLMNRANPSGGRRFVDATVDSGYGAIRSDAKPPASAGLLRSAQLAVLADVDNDGDLDVFSGTYRDPTKPDLDTLDRNDILLNDGKGKFTLAKKSGTQTVPSDLPPPTSGASFVDVDHDGIVDVWVGFWYRAYGSSNLGVQARLFKGNGDGTFTDVTPGSGLETQSSGYVTGLNHRPAYGVTTCDLDGDGLPELLVSAYGRQWNLLYKNNGGLKFTEVGQASGYAADDNVDYTDNEFYKCYCQTSGKCTADPPSLSCASGTWSWSADDAKPWRNGGNTFTTACGDLDGDGLADLYNAEIHHWHIGESSDYSNALFNDRTAQGAIHFKRADRKAVGLEWAHPTPDWNEGGIFAAFADLDLDGRDDIAVGATDYPGNYSMLFRNKGVDPAAYEEVGKALGLHHECTNGMAIADFDRDGDLDVVVGSSTARDCAKTWTRGNEVHFYENKLNDGAAKRGFLQIALEGRGKGGANRTGIGARVRVLSGGRIVTRELTGGYGHFGMQHDTVLTFGLGNSCTTDEIEVRWPNADGTLARYKGIGGGRRILIKEDGTVVEQPVK